MARMDWSGRQCDVHSSSLSLSRVIQFLAAVDVGKGMEWGKQEESSPGSHEAR